jgi:hypothetical protein
MSTRISSAALLLLATAGCGRSADQLANTAALDHAEAQAQAEAEDDGRVLCARGGAALEQTCTVEQTQGSDGLVLTLRHPDGGFRRLKVTRDGRGVVAADGADAARVAVIGPGVIEVTVGTDRYRLPATVKPAG